MFIPHPGRLNWVSAKRSRGRTRSPVPFSSNPIRGQGGSLGVSQLNNPIPSVIAAAAWLVSMLLMRLFRQVFYFVVAVASVGGLFLLLTPLVERPRPTIGAGICSGHVSHDVVYSGFLQYITLGDPVRRWRYRWFLIPLRVFFVLDILLIGYSRLLEGDHWLLDVLGGYLVGALWLALFVFLYRRTAHLLTGARLKRLEGMAA
jgi:membrane-associated phospholipid phosphatase